MIIRTKTITNISFAKRCLRAINSLRGPWWVLMSVFSSFHKLWFDHWFFSLSLQIFILYIIVVGFLLVHLSRKWAFLIKICPKSFISVVVVVVVKCSYFHLLLNNHWTSFNQTWYKAFLDHGNSSLFNLRASSFFKGG